MAKKTLLCVLGALVAYWIYYIYRGFYGNYEPKWIYYVSGLFAAAYGASIIGTRVSIAPKRYILRTLAVLFALSSLVAAIVHVKDFLIFSAAAAGWYLVGDFFTGLFATDQTRAEKTTFSMSSGMVIFSYILLAMGVRGMFGAAHLWLAVIIIASTLAIRKLVIAAGNAGGAMAALKVRTKTFLRSAKAAEDAISADNGAFALTIIAAFLFIVVVGSNLAPPTLVDDILYHLPIPKIWARNGAVTPVIWTNLPFSLEILLGQGMAMGSEYIFAGLTNIAFAALLFAAFFNIGRRFFGGAKVGVHAFLFLFSVVYYILHLFSFSTDMKFLLFVVLAFHSFLAWRENRSPRHLLMSAAMAGFSMGFRYQGLPLAAFLAVAAFIFMITFVGEKPLGIASKLAAFCLVASAAGFPWYLKHYIEVGNPVWPAVIGPFDFMGDAEMSYYYKLFGDTNFPYIFGYYGFGTSWAHLIKLPWNLTFAGGNYEGYAFTPVYLAFIPFAFSAFRRRNERLLLCFALFNAAVWFCGMQQLKFLIPSFAAIGIATVSGFYASPYYKTAFWRRLFFSLMLFPAIYSVKAYYESSGAFADKLPRVFGKESRDAYLAKSLPYHNFVVACNRILPEDAVVFAPVDKRLFYLDRNYIVGEGNIQSAVDYRAMSDFSDLVEKLRGLGVTHMIDVKGNGDKLVYPHIKTTNSVAANIIFSTKNEKYLEKLHEDPSCGWILYKIKYPPPSGRAARPMNPELIGDDMLAIGMPDMAEMQYKKAAAMGYKSAQAKLDSLTAMTREERGDYYFDLVKKHKADRFIKFALDEYIKAYESGDGRQASVVKSKIDEVQAEAFRIVPHIWNNAPKIKIGRKSR